MTLETVRAIAKKYISPDHAAAKEDLATLMDFEGIDRIAYQVYTPSFNDGDPCEFTISYLAPVGFRFDDYISLSDQDGNVKIVCVDDIQRHEFEGYKVPEELERAVAEYTLLSIDWTNSTYEERLAALKKMDPKYVNPLFEGALNALAELILPKNSQGVIKRSGGTVEISFEDYDCGY